MKKEEIINRLKLITVSNTTDKEQLNTMLDELIFDLQRSEKIRIVRNRANSSGNKFLPITISGEPIVMDVEPIDLNRVINVLNGNITDENIDHCKAYATILVSAPRWYYIGNGGGALELEPEKREIYREELNKLLKT